MYIILPLSIAMLVTVVGTIAYVVAQAAPLLQTFPAFG
jgi:hypothetical protein